MIETGFWRTEIWHPVSVHFPIALLLVATLVKLIAMFVKTDRKKIWQLAGSGLLYVGCLSAWVAIYTGNLADPIVSRKICDPTILKSHEIGAYTLAYLFSAACLLDMLLVFIISKASIVRLTRLVIILLMLVGSAYLIYTGHLGASLVYEQGAGVDKYISDCK